MDFQGFDEIQINQESNMIHLKIRDLEESKEVEDKRSNYTINKLRKRISSHSSTDGCNPFDSDEELCGIQIAQKLFRDELDDQKPLEVQNYNNESDSQTSGSPCSNQDLILIRQKMLRAQQNSFKEILQTQTQHQEQSPFSIIPSKLNGEQKHMSQIMLDINNKPQKETIEEVGQHTTEELIRDITEANPVLNPIIRREISSHFLRRRNRFHTTIEISHPSFLSQIHSQVDKNFSNQISFPRINQQRNSRSHHSPTHLNNSSSHSTISQDHFNQFTDNNLQENKQEIFRNKKEQQFFSPQHRQSNKSDINKTNQEEGYNKIGLSEKSPRKAIFIRRPQHFMTSIVTRSPQKDNLIKNNNQNNNQTNKDAASFTQIPPSLENPALSSKKQEEGETDNLISGNKEQQLSFTKDFEEACERANQESPQTSEAEEDGFKNDRHFNIMEQVKEESNVFSYFSNSNNRIKPFLIQSPLDGNSDKSLNSLDNIEEEKDPSIQQSNQEYNQTNGKSSLNQNENRNKTIFEQISNDHIRNHGNQLTKDQDKQEVLESSTARKKEKEEEGLIKENNSPSNKEMVLSEKTNFEKTISLSKKGDELHTKDGDITLKKENLPEGCPDSQLKLLLNQGNGAKDKINLESTQGLVDPNKLFKEVPMHIIESRFYLKQVSQLKVEESKNQFKKEKDEDVFVMGSRMQPDMKPLRVYFFCLESVFLDFVVSMANTSIGSFVKYVIECYKSKSSMNQQLLRFQDQPSHYKILPSIDDSEKERHIADTNIPELSDKMMMLDAIGENTAYCCFVEVEEGQYEFDSLSHIEEGPEHDLHEFQNVYSKSGEIVFKVDFKEKEFSTIIRIGKDKAVGDLFDIIVKKKKIDIDKRSFFLQGKVFCSDAFSKLDYNLPLSILDDQYLKICRRDYEDREGGTLDNEKLVNSNQNNNPSETLDDEDEESNDQNQDEEDQDEDDEEQKQIKGEEQLPRLRERKTAKQLELKYSPQQQIQLSAYEEFKVTKVTYVSNEVSKRSQRVIGIDANSIYNRKEQSNFFSFGFILSFFFPASPYDTKCPTKKILDIKDMYIIDGTSLLIQFYEKNFIKYWFLFNKDPSVSKRMLEKLTYLRKFSEIRIFA